MSRRKLNNIYINIGMWACLLSAIIYIVSCGLAFTLGTIKPIDIFTYCWDAVFFLIIGNYFYRSKHSYYGRIMYAVLTLAICTFIIPTILDLIEGLIDGGINGLVNEIILVSFSTIIGIIYSVALIMYNKESSKKRYIFLLVMGILLFLSCILNFSILQAPLIINSLILMFNNISTYPIQSIVITILLGVQYIVNLLFGFVYFYTPLFFKNK